MPRARLHRVEQRAVGRVEVGVVEEQHGGVGGRRAGGRLLDLRRRRLDPDDARLRLHARGRERGAHPAGLIAHLRLDRDARGELGEAREDHEHAPVERPGERRAAGCELADRPARHGHGQRRAVALGRGPPALRARAAPVAQRAHAGGRRLEPRARQPTGAVRLRERRRRGALCRLRVADEQEVVAGRSRAHRGFADRARLGDGAHLEVVGDDHAAKADLAAQVLVDDPPRERRRHAGRIETRVDGVRRHHALDARGDGLEERHEVHGVHLVPVGRDRRQLEVRVERRVALAREMLRARRKPALRHAAQPRDAVAGDQLRVLAVRADADVGTVAVGQHVEAGPQVQVHAQAA